MIALHSVRKELGKGRLHKLVLNNVNWLIPPGSRWIIIGHRRSGKSTLLNLISGVRFPTSGWIERKGSICPGRAIMRATTGLATPRQLATNLSRLYHAHPEEIIEFVTGFASMRGLMDLSLGSIPAAARLRLTYGLIYSIPFDFYLFDGAIGPKGDFGALCRQAFDSRCQHAGVIVTTSAPRYAQQFDGTGGVLHGGKLRLYDTVEEALAVFNSLPAPIEPLVPEPAAVEHEEENAGEWI